jgi:hypothetical protein
LPGSPHNSYSAPGRGVGAFASAQEHARERLVCALGGPPATPQEELRSGCVPFSSSRLGGATHLRARAAGSGRAGAAQRLKLTQTALPRKNISTICLRACHTPSGAQSPGSAVKTTPPALAQWRGAQAPQAQPSELRPPPPPLIARLRRLRPRSRPRPRSPEPGPAPPTGAPRRGEWERRAQEAPRRRERGRPQQCRSQRRPRPPAAPRRRWQPGSTPPWRLRPRQGPTCQRKPVLLLKLSLTRSLGTPRRARRASRRPVAGRPRAAAGWEEAQGE